MRYISKILKFSIVLIFVVAIMSNFAVMAYDVSGQFSGNTGSMPEGTTFVKKVISTVLDVVRYIGVGIALIILMWIGAKFMIASPNERANIKQYSINYVIGAAILMGASGILTIVRNFAQSATGAVG